MKSITLVLPPLTQLNTPYPSISYLAHFLRQQGIGCKQRDFGIELALAVFSQKGLSEVFAHLESLDALPEPAWRAVSMERQHLAVIEPVIAFLQGRDSTLATRIANSGFLPAGPRMAMADVQAFGTMGIHDSARYLATLYLADLADLVTSCIDEGFALTRYQAHLATSAHNFDPIWKRLAETTMIDGMLDALCDSLDTEVVGLSVPFPGNLYGALRLGRRLKERGVYVVMGGGYVNTELRNVAEPRLWTCIDALTYDDGEGPLQALLTHLEGNGDLRHRTRTAAGTFDAQVERPPATYGAFYGDLKLDQYLQTIDTLNPAHRLWADGRWNKITLAHGCYWKRCTFCDVHLDYIGHYESAPIVALVDHMEELISETGVRGFHFVDEAAPPKLLRALAIEILKRNLPVSMWGNIRFEKSYDADLCRLLAAAGLIAVTGGLEVANQRLLKRIDKGVTVEQVARAADAFQSAGVMVHAYLMYGFPTQTLQESIDSMELVRQLFAEELISSAFWHRFVLTRHAPIFRDPRGFEIEVFPLAKNAFAQNDVPHRDRNSAIYDAFDEVLPVALSAWLQGRELQRPVHDWFAKPMPATKEPAIRIRTALGEGGNARRNGRLLWLGGAVLSSADGLNLHVNDAEVCIPGSEEELDWLSSVLEMASVHGEPIQLREAIAGFPGDFETFHEQWSMVREVGLVVV